MFIKYDISKLKKALQDFSNATGLGIDYVDTSLSYMNLCKQPINCYCAAIQSSPIGFRRCVFSDEQLLVKCAQSKKAEIHVCHAGLVDVAVPIFYKDILLGYVILGQMRMATDTHDIRQLTAGIPIDPDDLKQKYEKLPVFFKEKVMSIADVAVMLTKYILFENLLTANYEENAAKAISFIENNYTKSIHVRELSQQINISKTALYNIFRKYFDCTINEYINALRVEKSVELLEERGISIEEVSRRVGFSSAEYYSKVFKSKKGISPMKYRKQIFGKAR